MSANIAICFLANPEPAINYIPSFIGVLWLVIYSDPPCDDGLVHWQGRLDVLEFQALRGIP